MEPLKGTVNVIQEKERKPDLLAQERKRRGPIGSWDRIYVQRKADEIRISIYK